MHFIATEFYHKLLHQQRSGSDLETGGREVPCSIAGPACRPSRSEFSVVFSETRVNTGQDHLERSPWRALRLQSKVPSMTIGFNAATNKSNGCSKGRRLKTQVSSETIGLNGNNQLKECFFEVIILKIGLKISIVIHIIYNYDYYESNNCIEFIS